MFNHLSAVSESILALGWIAVVSRVQCGPCAPQLWGRFREATAPFRLRAPPATLKAEAVQAERTARVLFQVRCFLCSPVCSVSSVFTEQKSVLQLSGQHPHCFSSSLRHFISYPFFFFLLCLGDGAVLAVPQTWPLREGDE